ncbi:MAG: histidine--tRNA ligase [Peptococcaceae bacterium]|nr:histidine--tRNA ligase [Peptococcaceae bacterium]MDH7525134.1 histidine--tRNA ligase [Peptococcaceae bacterium]
MLTTRPRGTNDFLAGEIEKWHYLEGLLREVACLYGFEELRTPVFEHTELFLRGVGETTDIVSKEMYTFSDRGERSLTLRPEGTAPAVRAYVEHKLYAGPQPVKFYYLGPMFRYDRPQAGRYRQFHQFGVEVIGSRHPGVDAEVIAMALDVFERLGLRGLTVELNSVGCPECRPAHALKMKEYLKPLKAKLCPTCGERFEKNPLRILDCKNPECRELARDVPAVSDMLCGGCREHFQKVKEYLAVLQVPFRLEPRLVRGLDYYTMTAFEIAAEGIGAQSSICGGGRYDGLVEQCGGPPMPGIGFAMGLERILNTLEQQGLEIGVKGGIQVFIAAIGQEADLKSAELAQKLRRRGLAVERDYLDRSLKAQLKAADRLRAPYTIILGEDELKRKQAVLRRMNDSSQVVLPLDEVEDYLIKDLEGTGKNE